MKRLLSLALLLVAIVAFNTTITAAQDTGTPSPIATPRIVDGGAESSTAFDDEERARFWDWFGWPAWFGSMMLGIFWAYRRAHTSLVKAFLVKHIASDEENPLDRSPFVQAQPSSGGLVSGALLLALTTVFFLGQFAIYELPSDLKFPTEALDILPWLDFAPWLSTLFAPFLVGLLSESRGVWVITVLGYLCGMALWIATPVGSFFDLAYDFGEFGFLLVRVAIPALLMYLAYSIGRVFRGMFV